MRPLHSDQIDLLFTALSKAQAFFKPAKEDSANPFFKSKYANLQSIWDACKESLSFNGLSILQCVDEMDGKLTLITTLGHSSGQWMRSYMPIIAQKQDAQSMGSATSYARRYSLAAILSIVSGESEDDGEAAGRSNCISKIQINELSALMSHADPELVERIWTGLKKASINSFEQITEDLFDRIKKSCIQNIESKKGELGHGSGPDTQ